MSSTNSIIYKAKNLAEIQTILKNIPNIKPIAGATALLKNQTTDILDLPKQLLFLKNLPELEIVSKTERSIDFGSMVTLDSILALGEKNIPSLLYTVLQSIATPLIRTRATIGGNIASKNMLHSLVIPLMALNSKIEIRTGTEVIWIPFSRYYSFDYAVKQSEPHVISKVRVSTDPWDISFYHRLGGKGMLNTDTAYFVFLMKQQKNILSDLRFVFFSDKIIREKEFENLLLGRSLPIQKKEIANIFEKAKALFPSILFYSDFHESCFFNLLEKCLYQLS